MRVFENRVLRIMFLRKREEVAGECKRLHNAELHNLYASTNIITVMKSWRMVLAVHVARMGDMRCTRYYVWKTCKEETTPKT